jgi:hypothetical protein
VPETQESQTKKKRQMTEKARKRFLRGRGGNVCKNNDRACVSTLHTTIPRCNQLSVQLA